MTFVLNPLFRFQDIVKHNDLRLRVLLYDQ